MATILLVDDDPLQAYQRKSLLESRFSDVQRVGNAAEALCLVEQPHFVDNLGLIISGNHRPGLSGPAFVAELHTRIPSVPVLVLGSGAEAPDDYAGEGVHFLPRPVDRGEMLAVAGRMLAENQSDAA